MVLPYKGRRRIALACALRASRAADVRLDPFFSPASVGLRTLRGTSANVGYAVRHIDSRYATGCLPSDSGFLFNYHRKDAWLDSSFFVPLICGELYLAESDR